MTSKTAPTTAPMDIPALAPRERPVSTLSADGFAVSLVVGGAVAEVEDGSALVGDEVAEREVTSAVDEADEDTDDDDEIAAIVNVGESETNSASPVEVQHASESPQHQVIELFLPEQGTRRFEPVRCSMSVSFAQRRC